MSAGALRRATDDAQQAWAVAHQRLAAREADRLARIESPERAALELRRVLVREIPRAMVIGAQDVAGIVAAAGVEPAGQPPASSVGPPRELARTVARDWRAAAGSAADPVSARRAAAGRILVSSLSAAHDAGTADAIESEPAVVGYRRVARAGCCGACLALIDGRISRDARAFDRHPHCSCAMEPVVVAVNVRRFGRPTRHERFAEMDRESQNEMFRGHGGAAKASLVRDGHVELAELVTRPPRRSRRSSSQRVIEETPLADLKQAALNRMDRAVGDQRLSSRQRAAIREWQATDRSYQQVQQALRGGPAADQVSPEIVDLIEDLDQAIRLGEAPRDLVLYRGVRDLDVTVGRGGAEEMVGTELALTGYSAATLLWDVAHSQFTTPRGAILEIAVPAGHQALWVAGAGTPALRGQAEWLLSDGQPVRITGHRHEDGRDVVSMAVIA